MPTIFLRILGAYFILLSWAASPSRSQDDITPNSSVPPSIGVLLPGAGFEPSKIQTPPGIRPGMRLPASGVFLPDPGYEGLLFGENTVLDFELSKEQRKELADEFEIMRLEFDKERLKLVKAISNHEPVDVEGVMKTYRLRFDGTVSRVLMPVQVEQFRQLRYRREVENLADPRFAKPYLGELLDKSPEQDEKISIGIDALRAELQKEIKELVFRKQLDFLNSVLDEPQKLKLKQAVGKIP